LVFEELKKSMKTINFVFINGTKLRMVKTNEESKILKEAANISHKALNAVKHLIKPGISEIEIRNNLEFQMLKFGAEKPGFDSIVVSGERSALPHGKPSSKLLKEGELVTIDFGAQYKGYTADITRTFKVGDVTDQKLLEIFEVVKEAQELGIKAVKPGVLASTIDKICRDYIISKGYGEYFVHGTGHGLGVEVHEEPYVTPISKDILQVGNVITVEPGIYIPNLGGTRFEDDILVTNDGYEILSR
jgi:Xaa-Pro aminopeptidase